MDTVVSIIIGILLFSTIIIFHELGHLIVAKKNGIKVPEFMLGMGPKIFSFKKGETVYSLRLFLIGGACQMLGEDTDSTEEGSFNSKGPWARFATIFAGPFFNFILAFIFSAVIIGIIGFDEPAVTDIKENSPVTTTVYTNTSDPSDSVTGVQVGDIITKYDGMSVTLSRELLYHFVLNNMGLDPIEIEFERDGKIYRGTVQPTVFKKYTIGFSYNADENECKIGEVTEGGVLDSLGVRSGDVIVKVNGTDIPTGKAMNEYLKNNPLDGSVIEMVITHKGNAYTYQVQPVYSESCVSPRYFDNSMGFYFDHNSSRVKGNPLQVLKYSLYEVKFQISTTIKALGKLLTGQISLKNNVGGPVRIVSELDNTIQESKEDGILYVILNLLNFAILLSANLGVMNLLPIPALDGGRLVFLLIEAIRGKPVPVEKEGIVQLAGFVLLFALMIFVMFNDIMRFF